MDAETPSTYWRIFNPILIGINGLFRMRKLLTAIFMKNIFTWTMICCIAKATYKAVAYCTVNELLRYTEKWHIASSYATINLHSADSVLYLQLHKMVIVATYNFNSNGRESTRSTCPSPCFLWVIELPPSSVLTLEPAFSCSQLPIAARCQHTCKFQCTLIT